MTTQLGDRTGRAVDNHRRTHGQHFVADMQITPMTEGHVQCALFHLDAFDVIPNQMLRGRQIDRLMIRGKGLGGFRGCLKTPLS